MEIKNDYINSLTDRIIKVCKTNDDDEDDDYDDDNVIDEDNDDDVIDEDSDDDNDDDENVIDEDNDNVERHIKIKKIHDYITSQAPKNEDGWDYFRTCSRCEGFTIGYGSFYKINVIKPPRSTFSKKEYDDDYKQRENINQSITNKCSEVTIVDLPCCWPDETKLDFFIGFTLYPLLWTKRRYYIKDKELISVGDNYLFGINREKRIKKISSKYHKYELPDYMQDVVKKIEYYYCNARTWKDTLYLDNHKCLGGLSKLLDETYSEKINLLKDSIKNNANELKKHNLIADKQYGWCFLPSDCASCS